MQKQNNGKTLIEEFVGTFGEKIKNRQEYEQFQADEAFAK